MIQRPPACKRHAAEMPGTAHIVESDHCPFCWAEEREAAAVTGTERYRLTKDTHRLCKRCQYVQTSNPSQICDTCYSEGRA